MKVFSVYVSILLAFSLLASCASPGALPSASAPSSPPPSMQSPSPSPSREPATILLAAAASLEYSFRDRLIPMFTEKYPWITVEATYDSSGKLQIQIEEGLEADVFMSAATKQMNALADAGLVDADSVARLLENKIVLIAPSKAAPAADSFETAADAGVIAIGDPESVPAGQYAKEVFTSIGNWDDVLAKASLGTNVTEVLAWVAEGSADLGVVYATDAATTDKVSIVAETPEGSLSTPVIYPVGMVSASAHPDEAGLLIEFLGSPEALKVFEEYGFTPSK